MTDLHQCGLCLSCGVPFMPSAEDTDLFRHTGNLSVLFLNVEFKNNADIRRRFQTPKFTSEKQESHVFHESHHFTALNHMCNHHTDDMDLSWPAAGVGPGAPARVIADSGHGPLPYFKSPSSKKGKKAYGATWVRPPDNERLHFHDLLVHVVTAAQKDTARPFVQNFKEKYAICRACNLIMTQRNDMEYHLGLNRMREENNDPLIQANPGPPITQQKAVDHGVDPQNGYGVWTSAPGAGSRAPRGRNDDDLTPAIAYYLHMCLPFIDAANPVNPFDDILLPASAVPNPVAMKRSARTLFLELSWLILEIACVATLKERGRLYAPEGTRSHGPHQHAGVLDFYVSYFIFRLMHFEYNVDLQREGLDFVQWHQKYYSDAINCKELFKDNAGVAHDGLLASMVCATTVQPSRLLLEEICGGLLRLYNETLKPVIEFTRGRQAQIPLPLGVKRYFLPLPAMLELRRRSGDRVSPLPRAYHPSLFFRCGKTSLYF